MLRLSGSSRSKTFLKTLPSHHVHHTSSTTPLGTHQSCSSYSANLAAGYILVALFAMADDVQDINRRIEELIQQRERLQSETRPLNSSSLDFRSNTTGLPTSSSSKKSSENTPDISLCERASIIIMLRLRSIQFCQNH